jgi:signal transduction histidine kinase
VSVEDNGCGMSPDVLDHCLDPFFSHRPAGRGRGLGLSRAHSLAVANGGRLWLESTPGAGTTAFVELPAARTG